MPITLVYSVFTYQTVEFFFTKESLHGQFSKSTSYKIVFIADSKCNGIMFI